LTKSHPDKGGDAVRFDLIRTAYEVLSSAEKVTHNASNPMPFGLQFLSPPQDDDAWGDRLYIVFDAL